jgi:uncharacterized protein (DUF1800 family)
MIPFQVGNASAEDRQLAAYVPEGGDLIQILEPPQILAGQKIGYLRVASLRPGHSVLVLDGIRLSLENKKLPRGSQAWDASPEITSPSEGAHVWEAFTVAVEYRPSPPPFAKESETPRILLPDGTPLKPESVSRLEDGFPVRCTFRIRKSSLPEGPCTLLAENSAGSSALTIYMHQAKPDLFLQGEFEDVDPSWPRTKRIGENPPKPMKDDKASGNQALNNSGATPAWSRPIEVPEGGALVQFAIRARATPGQGALPSVSAYVDEELQNPIATVRLPTTEWEWVPLGRPTRLKAGTHPLTIFFRNDFGSKNGGDRNLFLDAYEIARLPDVPQARPGDLKISWEKWFDGRSVTETLPLRANLWLAGDLAQTAPKIRLFVNGKALYEQTGQSRPRCLLAPSLLKRGANELYWQADWRQDGQQLSAQTPVQTLFKDADLPGSFVARQAAYAAEDPAWTEESRQHLNLRAQKSEPSLALYGNGSVVLNLEPSLQGRFNIEIQGKGDVFEGRPEVQASLVAGEKNELVGKCSFDGGWNFRSPGQVQLPAGPKQLKLEFINDRFVDQKRDRNVFLSSVHLTGIGPGDQLPPRVDILYPPADQAVHGTDAVVAGILENDRIRRIDLLVDGKAQQLDPAPGPPGGPVLLPLLLRGLPPGPHELQVAVEDQAGNTTTTCPLAVQVLAEHPPNPGPYARAIRLLQRFGYGPEPAQMALILTRGETAWMREQLHARPLLCQDLAAYPNDLDNGHLKARIVRHHLVTPNPVQSRLLNWVENHFSTWERKAGTWHEYQEHLRMAALGDAPFREYLFTSATSPSMLYYLDQQGSFAGRINENYAREILELHTLGVKGGYTQQDVTSLARLLTGWTLAQEAPLAGTGKNLIRTFRFVPQMNDPLEDPQPLTIIGWPFHRAPPGARADRIRLILDLVADHPSTARYITAKLIHHYHAIPAPAGMEQEIAETFAQTGGDLTEVLRHIARHPSFWDPQAKPRLATPLDFSIRLARLVGETNPYPILDFLSRSGMGLYDRATPDGYPEEDEAYADSNALLQRWRFAQELENRIFQTLPRTWRSPREGESEEAFLNRVIDCYAIRLTGDLLSERSQQAALVLAQTCKLQQEERLKLIGVFICQLPEASLR